MAKIKVETEVSKELYELGTGIGKFALVVKLALADGFKAGDDLGPILGSALGDLVPGLQGVELVGEEFKEDKMAAVEAVILGLKPFLVEVLSKKA